ncbi:MAG: hypothetical protein PHS37_04695 [Candidatus Omnitrophica bacterium]|nr:hypothetical protein [Candidatus Omnitrophota bacterium]
MKKLRTALAFAMAVAVMCSRPSFAADEDEGFIKRMMKKFGNKGTAETKKAPVTITPVTTPLPQRTAPVVKEPEHTAVPQPVPELPRASTLPPARPKEANPPVAVRPTTEGALTAATTRPEAEKPDFERTLTAEDRDFAVKQIINDLEDFDNEIAGRVPGIIKRTDSAGKIVFKFKNNEGKELDFTELDDETLWIIYQRITNEAAVIRGNRINEQLNQLQNMQRLQNTIQAQQREMNVQNASPNTYIPQPAPQLPPQVPPQPPKLPPQPPPQPPQVPQVPQIYVPPAPPPQPPPRVPERR